MLRKRKKKRMRNGVIYKPLNIRLTRFDWLFAFSLSQSERRKRRKEREERRERGPHRFFPRSLSCIISICNRFRSSSSSISPLKREEKKDLLIEKERERNRERREGEKETQQTHRTTDSPLKRFCSLT